MRPDLPTVRGFFQAAPFMVDLGAEVAAVAAGRVTTTLTISPRHFQHTGQVHAGVMVTLADHTMGAAAQTLAPEGRWVVTAELKSSLLRPGQGDSLECTAVVIKAGRTLSFTEAEVHALSSARRTLVMKASATMALVPGAPLKALPTSPPDED
jgi:uncharacterized protein (TIGR00369 family)